MSDLSDDERAGLDSQSSRFALRSTCESCAHFVVERGTCAHGYPNDAHRDRARATGTFVFCKEFELQ